MKIKAKHIYLAVGIIAVVFLVSVSLMQSSKKVPNEAAAENKSMPQDEVHKGMQQGANQAPSKSNVSPEFLEKLKNMKSAADKNSKDTAKIREYADLIAEAHKTDEAIEYYEKIIKIDPKRLDIKLIIASLYYSKQDFTKCEITLNSVLSYDKNNYHALYNLGVVAATKGDNEKAKNIWNDLIKRNLNAQITKEAQEAIKSLK